MLIAILFLVLFGVVSLLLVVATNARAERARKTLSRLDAIALNPSMSAGDMEPLAIRRDETFSSLPWLDTLLARADFSPNSGCCSTRPASTGR